MQKPEFLQANLRRLTERAGWTYKQFAKEAGVSYHTVFRAITLGIVPRGSNLQKMASALGVSVSDLWATPPDALQARETSKEVIDDLRQTLAGMGRQIERITKENEALRAQSPIPGLTSEDLEKIQFMIATYEKLKFLLPEDFFEILCRASPAKIADVIMILEHDDDALREEIEARVRAKDDSELKSS